MIGVTLVLITLYHVFCPWTRRLDRDQLDAHLTSTFVLMGGLLAVTLFTGFFQLGSRGSFSDILLMKLGGTMGGGVLSIVTALGFIRGGWPRSLYSLGQGLALIGYSTALYGGIILS